MKISLHIEADTAAEFQQALDILHAARATNLAAGLIKEGWKPAAVAQEPKPAEPAPKPAEPAPAPAPAPQPTPVPEEQPPVAAEAPVKAKRGRPPKVATPEPMATAVHVQGEMPTALVQAAPTQAGNGTGAVTRQDLLDVFAEYVQRYGANFGYTDISGLLQKHLGEGVRKASDVPETSLGQAIAAIRAAILENPFNRKRDYA